jgi:protein-disulfide isomerase
MNKYASVASIVLAFILGLVVRDIIETPGADTAAPVVTPETPRAPIAAAPAAAPAAPAAAPAPRGPSVPWVPTTQEDSETIPVAGSPSQGPDTAPITMVQFSDFQCPPCSEASGTVRQLRERYGDRLRVVWRNNPLAMHNNAMIAAEAAMEAFAQGGAEKFWPMHDTLFQHQDALDRPSLDRYARTLGLDMARFQRAMDGHTHQAQIDRDRALLTRLGSRGTPNFYVNGTLIHNSVPIEQFVSVIDAALERALTIQPRARVYAEMVTESLASERREDTTAVYRVPVAGAPTLGPAGALVTVAVFSDFQCPFCLRATETIRALRARYGDEIRIVWKNEPLVIHDRARPAAQLAMEAFAQGGNAKFWQAHDLLFAHQGAFSREELEGYGRELGLDAARVRAALDQSTHDDVINADHALAQQLGVDGTPCFYVNGRRLSGARPVDAFVPLIDEVRRSAEEALRTAGTTRANLYERTIANGATALRFTGTAAPAAAAPPPAAAAPAEDRVYTVRPNPRAPYFGGANARVVIEHFSDFQCPFCGRVGPVVEQIRQRYGSRVKLVWRNFPLNFHPNAMISAEAAMEAYAQRGNAGFWPFHDLLFQHQDALDREGLERWAQQQHLDMPRFRAALDAHTHQAAIQDDMSAARATGADLAMPSFFINGRFIAGALPFEEFQRRIDAALAAP